METITIISLLVGALGLIATLMGLYFTRISFINPIIRLDRYLKKTENWEEFSGIEDHLSFYRYKKYPNFQIIIDWDHEVVEGFHEEWINDPRFPDKDHNASYYVRLESNSMLLCKELFVSLDGHRYFVPVPRTKLLKDDKRVFYYDARQIMIANIIGKYNFEKDIYEFAKNQKGPILIEK